MRAIRGHAEGTIVRLLEPLPEPADQEVVVLIPTHPDDRLDYPALCRHLGRHARRTVASVATSPNRRGASRRGTPMKRCLLDTDVLSFYLRGRAQVIQRVVQYLHHHPRLELSVMSYYELRRGLVRIGALQRLQELEAFVGQCQVWEVSVEVAREAAGIAGELSARGEKLDGCRCVDRGDRAGVRDWGGDGECASF